MACIFLINNVKTRFTPLKSAWNMNLGIHNMCTNILSVFCLSALSVFCLSALVNQVDLPLNNYMYMALLDQNDMVNAKRYYHEL